METKRVYFPSTTPQQRKLLFETWEQTGNVTAACRKAHVGRCTYYYWKPRFEKDGYAGLESYEKLGVPVGTGRVAAGIQTKWWSCIAPMRIGVSGDYPMKWPRPTTG
jgi:hypothetical protein